MKSQTNMQLDNELKEKIRKKYGTLTAGVEKLMHKDVEPTHGDIPESQILYKCSLCGAMVDYCYLCELTKKIWCRDCEENKFCISKEHEHHRIPNFDGIVPDEIKRLNYEEMVKK